MSGLGLVTVTHTRAPLDVLEGVSYVGDDVAGSVARLRGQVAIRDAAILSTCNRTEIYAVFDGPADPSRLSWFLSQDRHFCWGRLRDHVDLYADDDAVAHLFRVAAGVDSLAFGEAEIVAQVKAVHADLQRSSRRELLGLFEAAIRASREVRARVDVSDAGASLGAAAVSAARLGGGVRSPRVLVVGAGKIARSVLAALPSEADLVVVSRTLASAESLAGERGRAAPMDEFSRQLSLADTVFFCASSRTPILDAAAADAITSERTTPLVLVDLGLPRNVAAEVRLVEGIEVIDLDGLRSHTNSTRRMRTMSEVEPIVAREVARFRQSAVARSVAPLIGELRSTVSSLVESELDDAFPQPGPDRARAEQVVRRIFGRLVHNAITEIRTAAATGDAAAASRFVRAFAAQARSDAVPDRSSKEEVA